MKKKNISIFIFFSLSVLAFLIISPSQQKTYMAKTAPSNKQALPQQNKTKKKPAHHPAPNRHIASINKPKPAKKLPLHNREVIGETQDLAQLKMKNKISKDWQDKYKKNFMRMTFEEKLKDFTIEKKRSIIKVQNKIGRYLEHVVVRYVRPDGKPFAFEALVDSETGSLVQTWNRTRYEFKKHVKIDGSKYRYKE